MADALTSQEWQELARLSDKASRYVGEKYKERENADLLSGVALYAGRMAW